MIDGQEVPGAACAPPEPYANPAETKAKLELAFAEDEAYQHLFIENFCASCEAIDMCLSIGESERFGVWGGLTEWELRERRTRLSIPVRGW